MSLLAALKAVYGRARFKTYYEAETPVDLNGIGEFRNDAFPRHRASCWLDLPNADSEIDRRLQRKLITPEQAEACHFWIANGYLIVPGLIDVTTLDTTWAAYEDALARGLLGPRSYVDPAQKLDDRKLDPHLSIPAVRALQQDQRVLAWTDLLLGRKTAPFQTIMGHASSEQLPHSDSIHMTTYPLGFLVANWIAFEDVDPASGPLEYYPGSHRLPYILSAEIGLKPLEFKSKGYEVYRDLYEPAIAKACEAAGFEKQVFLPKRGDVLFWHANLVHGGFCASTGLSPVRHWSAISSRNAPSPITIFRAILRGSIRMGSMPPWRFSFLNGIFGVYLAGKASQA
jgi:hypothetical protein